MSLRENLRALPAPAWVLFGGTFVNRFGSFVMPFLILYLTRNGYSVAQAGMAIGAYGAGHIVASWLGGHLADRIGRRNTIVVSMFGSAITMLALSQARGLAVITIITLITGALTELYRPASHALIADLVAPEQRMVAFGLYRFAVNLGVAAGPATAGFLAERSFLYVFLGDAITSVAYGLIALFALPHGLRVDTSEERVGEMLQVIRRDRPFLLFLAATFCVAVVDFQLASTYALHVTSLGYAPKIYGMLISLNGLLIVLFELLITNYVQRFSPLRVMAIGYFLNNLGAALTGVARTLPALAAMMILWTTGEMIGSPVSSAYVSKLAPERYRGRYMGAFVLMFSIGMVVGPPLGTILFQHDPAVLWTACGVLGLIGATILLIQDRRQTRTS